MVLASSPQVSISPNRLLTAPITGDSILSVPPFLNPPFPGVPSSFFLPLVVIFLSSPYTLFPLPNLSQAFGTCVQSDESIPPVNPIVFLRFPGATLNWRFSVISSLFVIYCPVCCVGLPFPPQDHNTIPTPYAKCYPLPLEERSHDLLRQCALWPKLRPLFQFSCHRFPVPALEGGLRPRSRPPGFR